MNVVLTTRALDVVVVVLARRVDRVLAVGADARERAVAVGQVVEVVGTVAGSRTHRVWYTPDPPELSVAVTEMPTGVLYQPFEPVGALGLSAIVVVGGVVSDTPPMLKAKSLSLPEPSADFA